MNPEEILNASARAGRLLLESGAEIYRVEETISRILEHYHGTEASSFVTPSGIFVSFVHEGSNYSKVVRVKGSSLNLERLIASMIYRGAAVTGILPLIWFRNN